MLTCNSYLCYHIIVYMRDLFQTKLNISVTDKTMHKLHLEQQIQNKNRDGQSFLIT